MDSLWHHHLMVVPFSRTDKLAGALDGFQGVGRYTLTVEDMRRIARHNTSTSLAKAAQRMVRKGHLFMPRRGFYVIVPAEYRSNQAPPPPWFIDALMRFHEQEYYVGLLSAAAIYGAAHQQPQEFQVLTAKPLRPIRAARFCIRFFAKRHLERTATQAVKTATGTMLVSTPAATALDLVRYARNAGHLSHVATVLAELAEKITARSLLQAVKADAKISCVQRLGYLLDIVGAHGLAESIAPWVKEQHPPPVPLRPGRHAQGVEQNVRWRVLVNDMIEVDDL
jgi:predicted transcriptional regulator of viral defense system